MFWYFVPLLLWIQCLYSGPHTADLGDYNLTGGIVGVRVSRLKFLTWKFASVHIHWGPSFFQRLEHFSRGLARLLVLQAWVRTSQYGLTIFEMDSHIFKYSCQMKERRCCHLLPWLLEIKITLMELKSSGPGHFKTLCKFPSMHKNASFELLQFFSQTIKQNINSFSDCSFG